MSENNQELLEKISSLKEAVKSHNAKVQEAKVSKQIAESKVKELGHELESVIGNADWSKLPNAIEQASTKAQKATQALADALNEAGIEYHS